MKHYTRLLGIIMLAALLPFAACDNSGTTEDDTVISIAAIPGIVVPVKGETPVTTSIDTAQYTGTVTWSPVDIPFAASTVYTANIVLTAKSGFTLTGVAANFFTVTGAETVSNAANSGLITAVFPATGAIPDIGVTFSAVTQEGGTSETATTTALTLTFSVDPTTLTADNITLTGATKGSLTGTGTTRSLAITDITVANGATVTVTATSPAGFAITGSPQTVVVYCKIAVGEPYMGGIIAYILQEGDTGYDAAVTHGLIAASADLDIRVWALKAYADSYVVDSTHQLPADLGSGSDNTDKIIAQNGTGTDYAAALARSYNGGGYSDWYLPSKDELNKLYINRAAIGGFSTADYDSYYWSSTEYFGSNAWRQYFIGGTQDYGSKNTSNRIRPVRSF